MDPPVVSALLLPLCLAAEGTEWQSAGRGSVAEVLRLLEPGTRHQHVAMAMRDGVTLPSEVLRPAQGERHPTVLIRTPYGRCAAGRYARDAQRQGCAVVLQDARCIRGAPPRGGDPLDIVHEASDGADAVAWIAAQPWSNGRVGMLGGSGHGMAAAAAYLAKPPHLVAVWPQNTAAEVARAWAFQNGVRRGMTYAWVQHRGLAITDWPRPTLPPDSAAIERLMSDAAQDNHVVYLGGDGWFNCFGDATLAWFQRFAGGRVYATVTPTNHTGALTTVAFPSATNPAPPAPDFWKLLRDEASPLPPSRLAWYVLGDPALPARWRVTATWPPRHRQHTLQLHADGRLDNTPGSGERRWTYDPADPAPTQGGGFSYAAKDRPEPLDQRPLLARSDVLRFATDPLPDAVEIAGPIACTIRLTADVPDTTLVAKLALGLADGRELLLREGVGMARFRDGFAMPAPLPMDAAVSWTIPIPDLGAVFPAGGRIVLYLTSSSHPAFEIHPNTYEPASGPHQQRTAHLRLTCSGSRLMLPIIED